MKQTYTHALHGIETWLEDTFHEWKVPGLAVAFVNKEQVLYASGLGVRSLDECKAVTPETQFAIGSATKPFTTTLLSILIEEGFLQWDTPIKEYIPSFQMFDPFATERMTLRDMACHRSGLPRHELVAYRSTLTREELVARLRYLEPNKDFRTAWQYQNLLYVALGHIIEAVTGSTWEEWTQRRIFAPLRMENSNLSITQMQCSSNYALPYREAGDMITPLPLTDLDMVGPAGAINSTVLDIGKWLQLQLNRGKWQENRIVAEPSLEALRFPHMVVGPGEFPETLYTLYGLGWFIDMYRGRRMIHHGGNTEGFTAHMSYMPDENVGIVVLANQEYTLLPDCIAYHFYDQILGVGNVNWKQRFREREYEVKQWLASLRNEITTAQVPNTVSSHPLEAYTGHFVHPAYGEVIITEKDGQLHMEYCSSFLLLFHYHYDVFRAVDEERDASFLLSFSTGKDGAIDRIQIPLEPSPELTDIIFVKQKKNDGSKGE